MKNHIIIIISCITSVNLSAQALPDGHILLYQQDFSSVTAIKDFKFSNAVSWKISEFKENRSLEFFYHISCETVFHSPRIMGIIKDHIFGDFILEADLMQTVSDSEFPEMCILFSVKDSSRFYYINLASRSTDTTHGIFLVRNASLYKVSDWQTDSIAWGNKKWHKIRVERSIVNRMVTVYFDDLKKPVMTTRNPELVMGYLGFGSFSSSGRIDNIKIWAPTSIPEEATFFEGKGSP